MGRPNEDMKMSSAPSFGAPGGHIFDVVAPACSIGMSKLHTEVVPAQHTTRHKASVRQTDERWKK